jgi:seryl-tRNA synthetase
MLDINLFRTGRTGNGKKKDGDPDAVRESQRKRFASVEIVDEVIDLDDLWRRGKISSLLRGIEALPADLRRISDSQDSRRCRAARSG